MSTLEGAVKLVLIANDQVVNLRVCAQLVTMEVLAESSMVCVLLAVRFDFFVTHDCDARSSKKMLDQKCDSDHPCFETFRGLREINRCGMQGCANRNVPMISLPCVVRNTPPTALIGTCF